MVSAGTQWKLKPKDNLYWEYLGQAFLVQDRTSLLLRLEDKDLLQIDATVIAGVLVLSTVGALKLNITVIAWVASTWFSFSAFLILVSHIVKPDASTEVHKRKTNQVMTREISIGSMAAGFVYLNGVIFRCEFIPSDEVE